MIGNLLGGKLGSMHMAESEREELRHLESLLMRNAENLEKLLTDEGKIVFEKYRDCAEEYGLLCQEQAFCEGFCVGTRLTAEGLLGVE